MRLLLFLVLLPSVVALTPLDAGTMEATVLIVNEVRFSSEGSLFNVEEAAARLTWFPRDDSLQEVRSLSTKPDSVRGENSITYSWIDPGRSAELQVTADIVTRNSIVPIRERIPFPLQNVPPDVSTYLGEEEIIDQSAGIKLLAQNLAREKNDLYEVVFALADWATTNVEYSLASLGEPAIQKSSQVLATRWGKCDEITALFISMNRALGIPARFVAGYSYTNSDLIQQEWGGHGWSEVWFPDVGWVPFDVTYGEYGYLDAGHVKLKVSEDAKETSVDYTAKGTEFTLHTEPLDIFVTPKNLVRNDEEHIRIKLEAPYAAVGFGSAVMILANVENRKNYYVATRLDLAQTTRTSMLSDTYHNVLLKPYEQVTIPFLVKIEDELDEGFRYEFPFRILSRLGEEETIMINVHPKGRVLTEADFDDLISTYVENPTSAPLFSITCDRGKPGYVGSSISHSCVVNDFIGDSITICDDTCESVFVEDDAFTYNVKAGVVGVVTKRLEATHLGQTTEFLISTETVAPTNFSVTIENPTTAKMNDLVVVEISLDATGAEPVDIDVVTTVAYAKAKHIIDDLPTIIQLTVPGTALRSGENDIIVSVSYEDELGTQGTATGTSTITLTDANWVHKVRFVLTDIQEWLVGLFT